MAKLFQHETHPRPLFLEGRAKVPSSKRGFRGVFDTNLHFHNGIEIP